MLVLVASRNTSIHVQHLMFYTFINTQALRRIDNPYLNDVVNVVGIESEEETLAPIGLALCKLRCTLESRSVQENHLLEWYSAFFF
jgi:hypothetical protein